MKMTFDIGAEGDGDSLSDGENPDSAAVDSFEEEEEEEDDDMDDFVVDDDEIEYETGASQQTGSSDNEAVDFGDEGQATSSRNFSNDRPAKRQKRTIVLKMTTTTTITKR